MAQPIIRFDRLSYTYEGQTAPALREICFSVSPGEWVSIVGPGGSGKTTICSLLSGSLQSWPRGSIAGKLWVEGEDHTCRTALEAAGQVGIVYHDPELSLIQEIVEDDVVFGPENICLPPEELDSRIAYALQAVNMADARKRRTNTLSGGQQQRIAIASVLAMKPGILLLDNVSGSLDAASNRQLLHTLQELHRQGHTIITTTSRLDAADEADRVIILNEGSVAAEGTAEEVKNTAIAQGVLPAEGDCRVCLTSKTAEHEAPIVTVNRLQFSYSPGQPPALSVSGVDLYKGELVSVHGPNGSGKTTFGKLIAGLLPAPPNAIFLQGQDAARLPMPERSKMVGYVFQRPEHQFVGDNVLEECLFGLQPEDRPHGVAWLEKFGLRPYEGYSPHQLPDAQKRLLNIASATIRNPDILVLDEPTAGLDYRVSNDIMQHCADYAGQGKLVIMITHDEAMASRWSTRAIRFQPPGTSTMQ